MKNHKGLIKEGSIYIALFLLLCQIGCKKQEKLEEVPVTTLLQNQLVADLGTAEDYLDSISLYPENAKDYYYQSRMLFKKTEPLLSFLDIDNYTFLNQPNILKIEEEDKTDIKMINPSGYQVLEETLYDETATPEEVEKHAKLTAKRLALVADNISLDHLKEYHLLWMIRKSFVQVALTGITGFDSPVLENSLTEAQEVYQSLETYLSLLKSNFTNEELYQDWIAEIKATKEALQGEFNSFDRYYFIKEHTHAQLKLWNRTVKDWNVSFPFTLAIQNDATSLFGQDTFNKSFFAERQTGTSSPEKIALGKKLFYDTNLSTSKNISCATCHQPELAFTDGLKISKGLTRNSPTLLYAGLQQAFFYDKRAGSLEGQIMSVVANEQEFHTDLETLEKTVIRDDSYQEVYKKVYGDTKVSQHQLRNAIATYIRDLAPFNSKLDRNMRGEENSLSQREINGFNVFHGKGKCATCHFPPLYNGTVPPNYKETEMELIGVPKESDTVNAVISPDLGRYYVFETEERKHFFKTPTVRNSEKTAPYMHNGVYTTLEEVVTFYKKGGGAGIGIDQPYQTLPPDPLALTAKEEEDLILFMKTLTD
ncbi:methylamine utilization protein [Aquimarina sp. ERC-38]|uniref:cytochrome-c peroxidase n=1 Tax=Aquimarina sp. ERC-38 TaxID=2949996 RepID=UPI00224769CC|nr:cytochrome c peroxidase [Aquimarina sp. ERC-38]UZO79680.1 methylamine utilization protein [Aquimarina sp. ERC-38]